MEGEAKNFGIVVLYVIASLCYSYFVSSRIPKGIFRLISLFPIFYIFTILPLFLSYVSTIIITTVFIAWLANFKLLLFAFNKGPLCSLDSLPLFIIFAAFPIKMKQSVDNALVIQPNKWYRSLAFKVFAFGILLKFLYAHKEEWNHDIVALLVLPWVVFLFLEVYFGLIHLIIQSFTGLELEPFSNEPYLATSFQDFWGKRWNVMVTDMLRQTVYCHIKLGCAPLLGKRLALFSALMATFLVSGLMHEQLAYNLTRTYPTWEMMVLMVVPGILLIFESIAKIMLGGTSFRIPTFMSRLLTLGSIHVIWYLFFYRPISRSGVHVKFFEEHILSIDAVKNELKLLLSRNC